MESGSPESVWAGRLARTPFAAALAKGAPLFVACGEPPRVAFATPAALAAFAVGDARALGETLFGPESLDGRRLRRLAGETPLDAAPQRERLAFFLRRDPASVSWTCARFSRDGETFFAAADLAADLSADPFAKSEAPARFLWSLDREDAFGAPDAVAVDRLGAGAPREGETLAGFIARTGLNAALADAIAARATFSRLRVVLPEQGGEGSRTALLSGAPVFNAERGYLGFRGFGLATGERAPLARRGAEVAPRAAPRPAAPAAKPATGDAAALISLLQRHHPPAALIASAPGAASAPALAVISALAALLQPKPQVVAKKSATEAAPSGGAEIVRLRPHVPASEPARGDDSVALTSQEREAFKEIARSLGVNVRAKRAGPAPAAPPPAPLDEDLSALLDDLPIGVLVFRAGEALYANKTLLDLAGYADLADFCARDGVKTIFRGRDPGALAPDGAVVGVPVVTAGESLLTVDAQVRPVFWRGAPAQVIALRRSREADHLEEMRAVERETAVHAARARDFAAALDAARDGMVRLDRSGRVLGLNAGAERLFGCDQKEAAGESFLDWLAPPGQAEFSAALERLTSGQATPAATLEVFARARDGRALRLAIDLGRFAQQPEPDYFALLTEQSGVEAPREEAERRSAAKTELLSRVSGEIRTPMRAILGFAETMLEERYGPLGADRYRECVKDIQASGRQVLALVGDLVDLTKLELGEVELHFAPLDVNKVVRECVLLMQPQAARERVIVRLSLYERLPNVTADERSLRQILLNLLANAVNYNEPGGQVILSTALDDAGGVVLRVRDTGVGMNEGELAVALAALGRAPGDDGAGLPLTKALVEANHGDFSIKSRKDQGTLVEIAFPLRQAAQ